MARKNKPDLEQGNLFKAEIPKMPEGYYSGDKPNPNLKAFVEQHLKEKPYDPAKDDYQVPAFDKPIKSTKATAIYNMHTYWSKKPHDAIREYIRHYTQPGDLVLDPFCGSGGTALAALMEGRKAIAIDRSPAATFITKNYCTPVDVDELQKAFNELKQKVKPEMDWLYETRCDRCGGKATTAYTVYSQVFQCPRCMNKVALFDCVELEGHTAQGKPKTIRVCPHCHQRGFHEEIKTDKEKFGAIPVLVSYLCENGCKPARGERRHDDADSQKRDYFEKYDLAKLQEIENREIPYWYPKNRMMNVPEDQLVWGAEWRPGRNFRTVAELFTKRNLWALAAIKDKIKKFDINIGDQLLFAFDACILGVSRMVRESNTATMPGTYYIPQVSKEVKVISSFENKFWVSLQGWQKIGINQSEVFISNSSATHMDYIIPNSIDYIFTDPPYAEKVQYGELNFIWETWLGFDTHWHDQEIIVNEVRGKTENDWTHLMRQAMTECYRILKPGRCISLCYHDTSEGTWSLVQDIMAEAGFLVEKSEAALFIDTKQKSYNQLIADKVNKRDLVINFQKPKSGQIALDFAIQGTEDPATFREKVKGIIRNYLTAQPGSTKDKIYDEVVSRMVRAGQMEAHNFDEILKMVAEDVREPLKKNLFENEAPNLFGTHEISRWYLKETEFTATDAAETAREDYAATKVSDFIAKTMAAQPAAQGVHYSDLFEHYVYSIKDKPRRLLSEWLPDYFYKTEDGTWRLPQSEAEQSLKAEGRKQGTNRRIKHYLTYLQQGVPVPEKERPNDSTLGEWIRHCKRSGLYEQGKLLYEKSGLNLDNLPEETMVNVEEDYQVCVRSLERSGGAGQKAKK